MATEVCLFDVDGTLTKARNVISEDCLSYILELNSRIPVALVSGSDYAKVEYQLGGPKVMANIKFAFTENGLVVHEFGREIHCTSIVDCLGEDLLQDFINYCLCYMSKLRLPLKRGTFIEFRKGLINLCPIGRSCSQIERDSFEEYDKEHSIRERFVQDLRRQFGSSPLEFAIGGQISIDAYPTGWDKRYCLQFLTNNYEKIHFFGDRTSPGGNDHFIFCDTRTIGHTVTSPKDTIQQLQTLFPHNR